MRTPRKYVAKDGTASWKVRYRRPSDGTETSETFYDDDAALEFAGLLRTLGAARALAYIDAQAGGDRTAPVLTIDELFDRWHAWKSQKKRDGSLLRVRSQRTLDDYRSAYDRRIKDRFGSTPANLLAPTDVQAWVDELGSDVEPKTVRDYHWLLHGIFLWGVNPTRALVVNDPCADTDLPKRRKKPPKGLRPDEWQILHAAATQVDPAAADLLLFKVSTGWRWSECVAVPVYAVDHWLGADGESFTYVSMGRVLRRVGSTFEIVEDAKSEAGGRRVRIKGPAEAMVLRRIRGRALDELLLTNANGGRWVYSVFHDRIWTRPGPDAKTKDHAPRKKRILEVAREMGLNRPDIGPHWLRHTHVGMLILAGEPLSAIQKRLGHASIETTNDVYGRMIEDASSGGLDRVAAMLTGLLPDELPPAKE